MAWWADNGKVVTEWISGAERRTGSVRFPVGWVTARTALMFAGTVAWSGLGAVLYAHFDLIIIFIAMAVVLGIGVCVIEAVFADTGTVGGFLGVTFGAALGVGMLLIGSGTLSDFVLRTRGEVITAVVADKTVISQHDGATVTYRFALRHEDGRPVYGELHEYNSGEDTKVGDRVTVVEDPGRLVVARLPQDVRLARDVLELSVLAVALAVAFVLAAICDERARRTELGASGEPGAAVGG